MPSDFYGLIYMDQKIYFFLFIGLDKAFAEIRYDKDYDKNKKFKHISQITESSFDDQKFYFCQVLIK